MTEAEQMHYAAIAYGGYIDDAKTPDTECEHGLRRGRDGDFYVLTADDCPDWTPRTDNGQAFELAMLVDITVRRFDPYVYAIGKTQHQARFDNADDMMDAAREDVFMAAVEIGKAM